MDVDERWVRRLVKSEHREILADIYERIASIEGALKTTLSREAKLRRMESENKKLKDENVKLKIRLEKCNKNH
jgi:hypothetical protein